MCYNSLTNTIENRDRDWLVGSARPGFLFPALTTGIRISHENLSELVEETKDEPVPLTLDKYQVKKLLETNGATPEKLEEFEQRYAQVEDGPGTSFVAANVVNTRSFEIKTPDVSIKVSPDKTYLVENRMIEGRPCIVIAINEHVEINGITVRPVAAPKGDEDENVPF